MSEISGLPAHVLLVHGVVVLLPLAALCVVLTAVWSAARRRLGVVTPLLAVVAALLVPAATSAGEWLLVRIGAPPLAAEHAQLGRSLWWFSTGLALLAVAQYAWFRWGKRPDGGGPRWIGAVLLVLAIIVPAATVVRTFQVGESGSRSVWEGTVPGE